MSYTPTVWQDGDHVTAVKLNKLEQGVDSMSYTPTVWTAGDVVTAEKLNKLEQGVAEGGGGGMDVPTFTVTVGSGGTATATCDKTYNECKGLCTDNNYANTYFCFIAFEGDFSGTVCSEMEYIVEEDTYVMASFAGIADGYLMYYDDGTIEANIYH